MGMEWGQIEWDEVGVSTEIIGDG